MISIYLLHIADVLKTLRIDHANYKIVVSELTNQALFLAPGELIVLVGPSRAGKSEATREAMGILAGLRPPESGKMPVVWIDNENSQANGEFSTRAFMLEGCRQVNHPIYGATSDDDALRSILESRTHRAPEALLRDAFETALIRLGTKYLVIDEAHHVQYVRGGATVASKVLDSYKCLARKTGVVLVLVGSYSLINLIASVPHMCGRQRLIEFPPYRAKSRRDRMEFEEVLGVLAKSLPMGEGQASLRAWNQQLFEGSLGSVGHLLMWIRSALSAMSSSGQKVLTWKILSKTELKGSIKHSLETEIHDGVILMGRPDIDVEQENVEFNLPVTPTRRKRSASSTAATTSQKSPRPRRKPFTRKSRRNPRGGRV